RTSAGDPVGRVCLLPTDSGGPNYPGLITVGGLAGTWTHHFAGVLKGNSLTAARNSATVDAAPEEWIHWSTEQAILCTAFSRDEARLHECEDVVWQLGGATADLPVARNSRG